MLGIGSHLAEWNALMQSSTHALNDRVCSAAWRFESGIADSAEARLSAELNEHVESVDGLRSWVSLLEPTRPSSFEGSPFSE